MKVALRRWDGKKHLHNLVRQGVTTASFGFCQPFQCREMISQDHIQMRCGQMIRLQPVEKPTFGRLNVKTYHTYVPIEDIWHPFASFLDGKTYSGANKSYIPIKVPFLPLGFLTFLVYLHSGVRIFGAQGTYKTANGVYANSAFQPDAAEEARVNINDIFGPIVADLFANNFLTVADAKAICTLYQSGNLGFTSFTKDTSINSIRSCDWFVTYTNPNDNEVYIIGGRLNEAGKNLQKIMLGCGYQLNFGSKEEKSILKLAAYYKAWFDLFAVQRNVTWKQTKWFQTMEYIEQYGVDDVSEAIHNTLGTTRLFIDAFDELKLCYYTQSPDYVSAHISGTAIENGSSDRFDLLETNVASGQGIVRSVNTQSTSLTPQDRQPSYSGQSYAGLPLITQQGLDVLKQLYKYVNIKTAVGGRIADFMRSIFGSDYRDEKESNFIGAQTINVDINPVMSQAETTEGYLGEFAGQGFGSGAGEMFDFTASCPGYLISMFAIVPDARWAQCDDPDTHHLTKFDFFTDMFDALTLLPSRKSFVYNSFALTDQDSANYGYDAAFGNIPNYSEYKTDHDFVSGELAMTSVQSNLLPFSMSKLLPFTFVRNDRVVNLNYNGVVAGDWWRYIGLYRQIGNFDRIFVNEPSPKDPTSIQEAVSWLEYTRASDNFVVYLYLDRKVHSKALPMSQSFQTDGFQNSIKVQKA